MKVLGIVTSHRRLGNTEILLKEALMAAEQEGAEVEIFQDVKIRQIRFTLQRSYLKPGYSLSWERTDGDMKYIFGNWQILDTPRSDTKLVIYTSYFKYGGMVPTRLSRNWAMKEVAFMAENSRIWILENRQIYHR